jgi:hypothetical protein
MDHDQEVLGSNPGTVYWMDVSDLLAITLKEKLKIKVAKWGKPKQYLKKKVQDQDQTQGSHDQVLVWTKS